MKKLCLLLVILGALVACSSGQEGPADTGGATELNLNNRSSGSISEVGEVDWYHYRAVETNNVLQITCNGDTAVPQVEFLAQVYERDSQGNLVRIWGDHAPEDAAQPANLVMNIPVDHPKDLYISVRDLMDDEASDATQYHLQLTYTHEAVDNETFAQALDLSVDDASACDTPYAINEVGDVDCYRFDITTPGVYAIQALFNFYATTPVRLDIKVYDDSGTQVYSSNNLQATEYLCHLYLETGEYYIAVQDQGRDDADPGAIYNLCLTSVSAGETVSNDAPLNAQVLAPESGTTDPTYLVTAGLEYQQDQDWFAVDVATATAGFQTMKITFNDSVADGVSANFEIVVMDPDGEEILVHDYPNGAYGYVVQLGVDPGRNLIGIRPATATTVNAALDYTITIEVLSVEDAAESEGDGNDGINQADALALPDAVAGKIGFRGDVDWYRLTVPAAADDQVLSIYLAAQSVSEVEYCVDIMNGGQLQTLSDTNGLDVATQLKTSYYIRAEDVERDYFIRVGDCQADDGDDVIYDLTVALVTVPATIADFPGINDSGNPTFYSSEADEQDLLVGDDIETSAALEVECAIYPHYDPEFKANNQVLKVAELDANNEWVSDWIAGYVDYQEDQDWFVLDIGPLHPQGNDTLAIPAEWYYDIEIRLYSPGSEVEYAWKLYRDRANGGVPNGIVIERTPGTTDILNVNDRDGILAAWSTSLIPSGTASVVDKTVPDSTDTEDFWIGDRWQSDRFYLSLSDFNYTFATADQFNTLPDADWGYVAPYYFQVKLTFHPDASNP